MIIDIACGCSASTRIYRVTDSDGCVELCELCGECAGHASEGWAVAGHRVEIVRDEPTEPILPAATIDASTYWATVLGSATEHDLVEWYDLCQFSFGDLMAWLETCEAAARAAGATGLDDVFGLRWNAAAVLLKASESAMIIRMRPDRSTIPDDFDPIKDSVLVECPLCTVSNGLHDSVCPDAVSK